MARRSQRVKIRFQALKAVRNLDRVMENIHYMDELALDRSDVLNEHIPMIVLGIDTLKSLLESLRANL